VNNIRKKSRINNRTEATDPLTAHVYRYRRPRTFASACTGPLPFVAAHCFFRAIYFGCVTSAFFPRNFFAQFFPTIRFRANDENAPVSPADLWLD